MLITLINFTQCSQKYSFKTQLWPLPYTKRMLKFCTIESGLMFDWLSAFLVCNKAIRDISNGFHYRITREHVAIFVPSWSIFSLYCRNYHSMTLGQPNTNLPILGCTGRLFGTGIGDLVTILWDPAAAVLFIVWMKIQFWIPDYLEAKTHWLWCIDCSITTYLGFTSAMALMRLWEAL